jgi:hypothetical protein
MTNPTSKEISLAKFLRSLSSTALDLAAELESSTGSDTLPRISFRNAGLGVLQLGVAETIATADPIRGISPREVGKAMGRTDEPNIRTAIYKLAERGVIERVPDLPTQRWRITKLYQIKN